MNTEASPKASVVALVQARLTSTRLPNKVLAKIGSWKVVELMYKRLQQVQTLANIVFVIPDTKENDLLADYLQNELRVPYVRGSENDVLGRFVVAAEKYPAQYYVRLTADCPLICPELIDDVVYEALKNQTAYVTNVNPPSYPDGFDVECISADALKWADQHVQDPHKREHVTYGFRIAEDRPVAFKLTNLLQEGESQAWMRLTLDNPQDLAMFQELYRICGDKLYLKTHKELQNIYRDHNLARINGEISRNEGLNK